MMVVTYVRPGGQEGHELGHVLNPWWVTGPLYAEGKHVKGHTGRIYSAPYGNGGADLEIRPASSPASTPWFCGCQQLDAAFFAAAVSTGAGWHWRRQKPRTIDQTTLLHCRMDLSTDWKAEGPSQLHTQRVERIMSRTLLSNCRLTEVAVDHNVPPEVVEDSSGYWLRHHVVLVCHNTGQSDVRFGPIYLDGELRLEVLSVTD